MEHLEHLGMNGAFDDQGMGVIYDVPSCSEGCRMVGRSKCHLTSHHAATGTASASGCDTWLIGKSQAPSSGRCRKGPRAHRSQLPRFLDQYSAASLQKHPCGDAPEAGRKHVLECEWRSGGRSMRGLGLGAQGFNDGILFFLGIFLFFNIYICLLFAFACQSFSASGLSSWFAACGRSLWKFLCVGGRIRVTDSPYW